MIKILGFFATFIFALLLMSPKASAMYDEKLNTVLTGDKQMIIDPTNGELKITIQYQYQVKDIQVFICAPDADKRTCKEGSAHLKSYFYDIQSGSTMRVHELNNTDSPKTVIFSPTAPTGGSDLRYLANGDYKVLVRASFCQIRNANAAACASEGSWTYETIDEVNYATTVFFDTITITGAYTSNSKVNSIIANILVIINDYAIPVLWILLGVLLIVRGIILSIDIVKASDEAEVRQSKIKRLTWLIIGVLAGYAITIGASWVMTLLGYGGIFS
jgi:hypothetical protein